MKVKDMEKEELRQFIQTTVEETLYHLFGDPDEGKELKENVKKRLKASLERQENGEGGLSQEEVRDKLGFDG